MKDKESHVVILEERIEKKIYLIRGQKVMLDHDLAEIYEVETKQLVRAVKRNISRFPEDFMFRLSYPEVRNLKCQNGTSSLQADAIITNSASESLRFSAHGGARTLPYAFTEHGIVMLSSVLRSDRAVAVNIQIVRTFIRLRQLLASHVELAKQLTALENRYDAQFKVVFDAIRELMSPPPSPRRRIGF